MEIFSLTHASDIDGVGSAALLKTVYGIDSRNIFFADYSGKGVSYAVAQLLKRLGKKDAVLFLTDLGMNDSLMDIYENMIKKIKKQGGKVIWFDHHVWSSRQIDRIASLCDLAVVGENKKYCATEITYRNLITSGELKRGDRFLEEFVKLVHKSDFNIDAENGKDRKMIGTYAMGIMSYNTLGPCISRDKELRKIVETISEGKFASAEMIADAELFDRINKKRTKAMLGKLYRIGNFASLGFSEDLQSTFGCRAIMDKTGCDLAVYINISKGTGHLRSGICDTTLLSKSMGGGGHPHASGFAVDSRKFGKLQNEKEQKKFIKFISAEIARIYGI